MSSPHGTPIVTFVHGGRGPSTNVPTNPVVVTPQAGTSPTPHDGPPLTVVHGPGAIGNYPVIDHSPGAIDGTPKVSIGDVHNPNDDPTRPASGADLGGLFGGGQGGDTGGIGHAPSGAVIPKLVPTHSGLQPPLELPPTSAIAGTPPWEDSRRPRTTPFTK